MNAEQPPAPVRPDHAQAQRTARPGEAMSARSKAKPWDGQPLVMLIGGPRHGWVYRLADYGNRGYLSSFDGYSPNHRRGDPSGELVMSTIGDQLRHTKWTNPDQAALPVQLWGYSEREAHR